MGALVKNINYIWVSIDMLLSTHNLALRKKKDKIFEHVISHFSFIPFIRIGHTCFMKRTTIQNGYIYWYCGT